MSNEETRRQTGRLTLRAGLHGRQTACSARVHSLYPFTLQFEQKPENDCSMVILQMHELNPHTWPVLPLNHRLDLMHPMLPELQNRFSQGESYRHVVEN